MAQRTHLATSDQQLPHKRRRLLFARSTDDRKKGLNTHTHTHTHTTRRRFPFRPGRGRHRQNRPSSWATATPRPTDSAPASTDETIPERPYPPSKNFFVGVDEPRPREKQHIKENPPWPGFGLVNFPYSTPRKRPALVKREDDDKRTSIMPLSRSMKILV